MRRSLWLPFVLVSLSACGSKTGLLEPGPNADSDAGRDAGRDAGPDAGRDAGPDASTDAGCIPMPESCNGLDDDCDGVADDGVACFFLDGQPIEPAPSAGCGASWYSYNFPDTESANPTPDIRRSGQVVLAIQHAPACGGAHLAVIADLPMDGSGGQLDGLFSLTPPGSAGIVVADEPGECTEPIPGTVSCQWVWQPCCTDGVLIGPFTGNACVGVRLEGAAGLSGLVILDGTSESVRPLPATLEVCTSLQPAVD